MEDKIPSQSDLVNFENLVTQARMQIKPGQKEMAEVEVPKRVMEYMNRHNPEGLKDCGYFIYNNVKVFEIGTSEKWKQIEALSIDQKYLGMAR